eukprot:182945_1
MLLRKEFQRQADELKYSYEEKMRITRTEASEEKKKQITAISARKTTHIEHLMAQHKIAFNEIKAYYNDITHQNLDLIKSLKGEVMETKKKEHAKEKAMMEIAQENRKLSEPFKKHLKDVENLKDQLLAYAQDKNELDGTKQKINKLDQQLKDMGWEHEVLFQKVDKNKEELGLLHQQLDLEGFDVAQKSGFRNLVMERKLETIGEDLEKKETALHEVMISMNMRSDVLDTASKKLEDVLLSKNQYLKKLENRLGSLKERYYHAIHLYEST